MPGSKINLSILNMNVLLKVFLLLLLASSSLWGQKKNKTIVGIATHDGAKFNAEFRKYDRLLPVYNQYDIEPTLIEKGGLQDKDWSVDEIYNELKKCHVVHLVTTHVGADADPDGIKRAERVGEALARYIKEGGGLFLQVVPVRYPNDDDEKYWNIVLKPLGVKILHEGVYDKTRSKENYLAESLNTKGMFWYTQNIKSHPVTKDVDCLYLPMLGTHPFPGLVALEYSPEWEIIVNGEKESMSYMSGKAGHPNWLNIEKPGTYKSAPPVVAVRNLGKGRIFSYPLSEYYTGMNYGNPLWSHIVESKGDKESKKPSHSLKMQMNAYKWLGETAQANSNLGTYKPVPYELVKYPESVNWDKFTFSKPGGGIKGFSYPDGQKINFTTPSEGIRGIHGLHSSYAGGKGTVAEYAKAAKKAGLSFIIFSDPLEEHTAETLEKLKADCRKISEENPDFYACPGIEFSTKTGIRWAFWGEKIVFPEKKFKTQYSGDHAFTQWDGKQINFYGQYNLACVSCQSAVIDYKQLREKGAHPENQWWFFNFFPLAYNENKLIANNYQEWLTALRDMRWTGINSFNRIKKPQDVKKSAETIFTGFKDIESAKKVLNSRGTSYTKAFEGRQYVSQGPVIAFWNSINQQLEHNWRYTRGAQRIRLKFIVLSENGIKDVKVHDADRGVVRRFEGKGKKELAEEFELVHDQQHYLTLEVTDEKGKKAFSNYIFIFAYKQGLFRCGDNLNILGATGMAWHPDRLQFFHLAKTFRNGEDFTIQGADRSFSLCPMPTGTLKTGITTEEYGAYPNRKAGVVGAVQDMGLNSHNIQIATMHMNKLVKPDWVKGYNISAAQCCISLDIGDLPFFERDHVMIAPMDRIDHYTVWNHRRRKEGSSDYKGSFLWHEGEIRFTKDVTLKGDVPIQLVEMTIPSNPAQSMGDTFIVTDADGITKVGILLDEERPICMKGKIKQGGYAAQMTTIVGYHAFLAPKGTNYTYSCKLPGKLSIGLGENNQKIKAGTVMKYSFVIGAFADYKAGNELLEHTVKAMNMKGEKDGYPLNMKVGTCLDATFFLTLKAKGNEVFFDVGPQELIIDLPIRVKGIEDNGCAAVYTTKRPWFRFVGVQKDTAWFQEPIDKENQIWAGNIFVADNKNIRLTVVVDGLAKDREPFIEVHNPTDREIKTTLFSPLHTPLFGGARMDVTVPAGDSIKLELKKQKSEK